jgi:insulysin
MIYIKPVKDLKVLSLSWEVPTPFAADNEKKALNLVAYALGTGGPNSLEEELKKERLAEGISVSQDRFGKQEALFNIDVNLT